MLFIRKVDKISRMSKRVKDYTNSDLYSTTIRDNKKTYIIGGLVLAPLSISKNF